LFELKSLFCAKARKEADAYEVALVFNTKGEKKEES